MATIPKSILKDLPLKLQDSSVKNRLELLSTLTEALVSNEPCKAEDSVPSELAAKSLAKILPIILPRYLDNKSRNATLKLIKVLLDKYLDSTFKVFAGSLAEYFSSWKEIVPTLYLVKIAVFGLQWSALIIEKACQKE